MTDYSVKDFLPGFQAADTVTFDCGVIIATKLNLYKIGSAAESASGLLMGVGTSASPATTSTADAKFVEIRAQTTATSGDNRLAYLRYDIAGATGGECIRAFTKINAAATTVRGAHISLDIADAGTVSSLGVGVDGQLMLGDTTYTGTLTAVNSEIYSAGTSTDLGGVSSFYRCALTGNATGLAAVEDVVNLLSISGGTVASGNLISADVDEAKFSHKIRMEANGTTYYLMCTTS